MAILKVDKFVDYLYCFCHDFTLSILQRIPLGLSFDAIL